MTTKVRTTTTVVPVVTPVSTTKTHYITKVWTITSCPPSVTNCPVGSVTTSVGTKTTVVPVVTPGGNGGSNIKTNVYSVVGPSANGSNDKTTTVVSTAQNTKYIQLVSSTASNKVETAVYVTATVVPVAPSAPAAPIKNNGTASATLSKPVSVPVGTPAAGCTGSACKITASSGVRNGVTNAAVVAIVALVALYQ